MATIALFGPTGFAAAEPRDASPWTLCARHAAQIEIREDLPPHLLAAISKVESGRWRASKRTAFAWPWTITAGGKGRFFATKKEAIEAARALLASGRRSIDVGCMQVNLLHHPDAFEDMPTALDPARNIAYAADLLQRLRRETRSWPKAIAYYHSRTSSLNGPYRRKVFRAWHEEWRQASLAAQASSADLIAASLRLDDVDSPASSRQGITSAATFASFSPRQGQAQPSLGQVQLGAFREPENARSVWLRLRRDNAALFGDLQPRIDVVNRGTLGTLHLLRIGPVMTVKHARSICSELLDRAIDCLVVEPPDRIALNETIKHYR